MTISKIGLTVTFSLDELYAECCIFIIKLDVAMLNVVAPFKQFKPNNDGIQHRRQSSNSNTLIAAFFIMPDVVMPSVVAPIVQFKPKMMA
jgi:hypothetical protein